jgi:hypothetical protein
VAKDPWPWRGDSAVERARRVAQSYRAALAELDRERCTAIDTQMIRLGQEWVKPLLARIDLDDFVTLARAGELVGLTKDAVYKWTVNRGARPPMLHTRRDDNGQITVCIRDVLRVHAEHRKRRAERRSA